MRRLFQPFVLTLFTLLAVGYAYASARLTTELWQRLMLALPFVLVWIVPLVYWAGERDRHGRVDELLHQASYISMGWVSFLLVLTIARDLLLLGTAWTQALAVEHAAILADGVPLVFAGSLIALVVGMLFALRGPRVRRIDIPIAGLHRDLDGFRIVQISDLHVGTMIRRRYVERVVQLTQSLAPDLIVTTGDMVDGPVAKLAPDIAPLARLTGGGHAFFILGNHDCYSGMRPWSAHFRQLGFRVLLNEHMLLAKGAASVLVAGVVDPAARMSDPDLKPRPDLAMGITGVESAAGGSDADVRLLLAHNPKIAPFAARVGFDLQLSGHTHAGQFFPWTLAVRLVHAPHVAGLSREGRMWVYVSAGTGTWGPPVRLGTQPELTLIRLVRSET